MNQRILPVTVLLAAVTATSAAIAGWEWRTASNPGSAAADGLKIDGQAACKVTAGGKTFLGGVKNGYCEYQASPGTATMKAAAPAYSFLASTTTLSVVPLYARTLEGPPHGVLRAASGEQGPILCSHKDSLGWVHVNDGQQTCVFPGGTTRRFSVFVVTPADGFVDLPPLWRDLSTTGGTSGALPYCRAAVNPGGPKTAPGTYSDGAGGSCSFLAGVSSSGAPIFAKTTDKSRFLVLFASTDDSKRLATIIPHTSARLRIGQVGNETAYGCYGPAYGPLPLVNGIRFRDSCLVPPASGSGPAEVRPSGALTWSVLGRWL